MTDRETDADKVFTADGLIEAFGDQAYHKALHMTVEAVHAGDRDASRALAAACLKLMRLGYHKYPKGEHP